MRFQSGFTLLEIMIVVVILGILAGLIGPQVFSYLDDAKVNAARVDIRNLASSLEMFRLDHGRYPTTDEGLEALVRNPGGIEAYRQGGYIPTLEKDPWKNPYRYLRPGAERPFDLWSHGGDGQPGGDGVDADLSAWDPRD